MPTIQDHIEIVDAAIVEDEAAAFREEIHLKAEALRKESAAIEKQAEADRKAANDATESRNKRTWAAVGECVLLHRKLAENPEAARPLFDAKGMIGPREGQREMASTIRFATGKEHDTKRVTLADGSSIPEWVMPRARDGWVAPATELTDLMNSGVVITDFVDFILNFKDPVSGYKNMNGLRAAHERRQLGDDGGEVATISAEQREEAIIKSVAATPTLFTVDAAKLAPGVVMGRVSEVLAIIGEDGRVNFQLSPRQDLAALQARLPVRNGENAIMPVKQACELFSLTAKLLTQGDTAMAAIASEDPTAPGTKLIQMTGQNLLIDGKWTSARSRDPHPQVLFQTERKDDSWQLPEVGAYYVNAGTRNVADKRLVPADQRELFDGVSLGKTKDNVTALQFAARKNSGVKDVSVSLPKFADFGRGAREMWTWVLDDKAFKPTASFSLPADELPGLAKRFVNPNVKKADGKHAEVAITKDGLVLSLGSSTPVTVAGKGENTAKLNVLARTLVDVLSAAISLKAEGLDFRIDEGGAVEIAFSTEANRHRVFIPVAAQHDKVWVPNHNGRFRRVDRDTVLA